MVLTKLEQSSNSEVASPARFQAALAARAHQLYDSLAPYPLVKYGVDSFSALSQPVVTKLEPLVSGLDSSVIEPLVSRASSLAATSSSASAAAVSRVKATASGAASYLRHQQQAQSMQVAHAVEHAQLVGAAWFARVDAAVGLSALSEAAVQQFMRVRQAVQTKATTTASSLSNEVDREKLYLAGVRAQLGAVWDDKFTPMAHAFYEQATKAINLAAKPADAKQSVEELLRTVVSRIEDEWKGRLEPVLSDRANAARGVYQSALEHYVDVKQRIEATTKDRSQQLSELVQGMPKRLGTQWNAKLEEPLKELFAAAMHKSRDQLTALQQSASANSAAWLPADSWAAHVLAAEDGKEVTDQLLHVKAKDVVELGSAVASGVSQLVASRWQGLLSGTLQRFEQAVPLPANAVAPNAPNAHSANVNADSHPAAAADNESAPAQQQQQQQQQQQSQQASQSEQTPLDLRTVRERVSHRLRTKAMLAASAGYEAVRGISGDQLKRVVHVDVVQLGEHAVSSTLQQLQSTSNKATAVVRAGVDQLRSDLQIAQYTLEQQPWVRHSTRKVRFAAERTRAAMVQLHATLHQLIAASGVPSAVEHNVVQRVQPHVAHLHSQLSHVVQHTRTAVADASSYLYNTDLSHLARDLQSQLAQLRTVVVAVSDPHLKRAQQAANTLMSSTRKLVAAVAATTTNVTNTVTNTITHYSSPPATTTSTATSGSTSTASASANESPSTSNPATPSSAPSALTPSTANEIDVDAITLITPHATAAPATTATTTTTTTSATISAAPTAEEPTDATAQPPVTTTTTSAAAAAPAAAAVEPVESEEDAVPTAAASAATTARKHKRKHKSNKGAH